MLRSVATLLLAVQGYAVATLEGGERTFEMAPVTDGSCTYPANCPNKVLPRADKQTWMMNKVRKGVLLCLSRDAMQLLLIASVRMYFLWPSPCHLYLRRRIRGCQQYRRI